jgi:hypothetical protein
LWRRRLISITVTTTYLDDSSRFDSSETRVTSDVLERDARLEWGSRSSEWGWNNWWWRGALGPTGWFVRMSWRPKELSVYRVRNDPVHSKSCHGQFNPGAHSRCHQSRPYLFHLLDVGLELSEVGLLFLLDAPQDPLEGFPLALKGLETWVGLSEVKDVA